MKYRSYVPGRIVVRGQLQAFVAASTHFEEVKHDPRRDAITGQVRPVRSEDEDEFDDDYFRDPFR